MEGVLEIIQSEGYGFLRPINYSSSSEDIYISASQIRRFDLRNGDKVAGKVDHQKNPNVIMVYYKLKQLTEKIRKIHEIEFISRHLHHFTQIAI